MTNSRALPDTTIGTGEPTASRIVLTLFFVGLLGLYSLFSNVFGWDNLPLLGELVPLVQILEGVAFGTTLSASLLVWALSWPRLWVRYSQSEWRCDEIGRASCRERV